MAQKRNPTLSSMVIALARQLRARVTLVQESMVRLDEGDCTANNVTDTVIPEVGLLAVGIAETFAKLVQGLTVHPESMRRNAELTNGLIVSEAVMMSLTQFMGRHQAHQLVYAAAQRSISEGLSVLDAIREHPLLRSHGLPAGFEKTLAIDAYVGESSRLVDEVIARLATEAREVMPRK
jgi:adenylosuccinate lyase/3-carboxy-cis,cis-muconate cycloisomerase